LSEQPRDRRRHRGAELLSADILTAEPREDVPSAERGDVQLVRLPVAVYRGQWVVQLPRRDDVDHALSRASQAGLRPGELTTRRAVLRAERSRRAESLGSNAGDGAGRRGSVPARSRSPVATMARRDARWTMKESESAAVIATLNEILELELAGVVRYSHYSLMI